MTFSLSEHPHKRFNPLTGEWVLVSPHRTQRPWQGQQEEIASHSRAAYDDQCYLCPGNERAGGHTNPEYKGTFIFTNDYSALVPDSPAGVHEDGPLFRAESEQGICEVICFSPRHDLSIPHMTLDAVTRVVEVWKSEYENFCADPAIAYVQIFENKGAAMGCSNPHPHCQVWASSSIPPIVSREQDCQRDHLESHGGNLLLDYLGRELEIDQRVVYQNDSFVVLVPFWAVWPFETMILPKRHVPSIDRFNPAEIKGLADAYQKLTQAYDRVFDCEFPYTAGIHQAPSTGDEHSCWQLHLHFYPPLLRSASVKKFMVGYEMLAAPQRDISPESAAAALRQALRKVAVS